MADSFHFSVNIISRGKGKSAVASAAYISGEKNLLMGKLEAINKEKDKIKDEYQEINHIKYSVDFVNKELGIDLSIEIDKLIKQGEKPSVIAQIKKVQDQVIKDNEYREMIKNKKMDQER
ncbi:hypothetical protein [Kallipyga massiliensis]|uniref:hypothetical protein n=1 Tax=Kallipyga massiliensis TaxID=1472764 RepID=UPI0004AE26A1